MSGMASWWSRLPFGSDRKRSVDCWTGVYKDRQYIARPAGAGSDASGRRSCTRFQAESGCCNPTRRASLPRRAQTLPARRGSDETVKSSSFQPTKSPFFSPLFFLSGGATRRTDALDDRLALNGIIWHLFIIQSTAGTRQRQRRHLPTPRTSRHRTRLTGRRQV